jgi:hypothetical protein
MATDVIVDQARAVRLAEAFLRGQLTCDVPPVVQVRHFAGEEREEMAAEVERECRDSGIRDKRTIQQHVRKAGFDRDHWVVSFRAPDPPGSATTLHATMVRVFDDTGETEFA